MKRVLAWLWMIVSVVIVQLIAALIWTILLAVLDWVSRITSLAIVDFLYWTFGGLFFLIALAPIIFGPILTIGVAEKIAPSVKGTRYTILATAGALFFGAWEILNIMYDGVWAVGIYMFIYSIIVGVKGNREIGDRI